MRLGRCGPRPSRRSPLADAGMGAAPPLPHLRQRTLRRRARSLLAAFAALLVIAAACSGSDDDDGPDPEVVDTQAEFCAAYRLARAPGNTTARPDLTDTAAVQRAIDQFSELSALAPPAIADDALVTEEVYRNLLNALEGTVPAARDDIVAGLEEDLLRVAAANERVIEWSNTNCQAADLDVEIVPTPTPTPLSIEG